MSQMRLSFALAFALIGVSVAARTCGALDYVTINRGGKCHTLASSGELLHVINELQNELDEGPCHTPDRTEEVVVVDDLTTDSRFATWGARVHAEHQLASVVSILVFTARGSYGTMSLYGTGPHAFDEDDLATAQALAGHLAVAIAAGREIEGMRPLLNMPARLRRKPSTNAPR